MKKITRTVIAFIAICLALASPINAFAASGGLHKPRRTYEEAVQNFEDLKNKQVSIKFSHRGLYVANQSILYARKIVGVNKDGTYQIGPWECISHRYNVSYCDDKQITLPATYIIYGYSFDITWVTDWPYSKEFWNNANTVAEDIRILITGGNRTPEVQIMVNSKTVYKNDNCPAHEQWIPH